MLRLHSRVQLLYSSGSFHIDQVKVCPFHLRINVIKTQCLFPVPVYGQANAEIFGESFNNNDEAEVRTVIPNPNIEISPTEKFNEPQPSPSNIATGMDVPGKTSSNPWNRSPLRIPTSLGSFSGSDFSVPEFIGDEHHVSDDTCNDNDFNSYSLLDETWRSVRLSDVKRESYRELDEAGFAQKR